MLKGSDVAVARRPLRRVAGYACAGGLLVNLAFSCAASDELGAPPALQPASSAERAHAREARSARARAQDEQPSAALEMPHTPPPSKAKPTASAEPGSEDAGPDAAASDAGEDAGVDATTPDAGLPPLCATICDRAVTCFKSDMLDEIDDSEIRERILKGIERGRGECVEECDKKRSEEGEHYQRDARACMDERECEAFLSCIRALRE